MTDSAQLGDRSLFPALKAAAYLNHAAISPPCLPTQRAVIEAMREYAENGVAAFPRFAAERQRLKGQFAELIGAQIEEIGLTVNTSRGVSDIALCLPWQSGDRVLLFEGEFPANVTPWQQAAKLFQLELVYHAAENFRTSQGLEQLEKELKRGLRLVAVSMVQFQTGLRMPLVQMGDLCARFGAELFVDGIQALGAVPLDVNEAKVTYLSTGGHKWLLGFEGAGFVYARRSAAQSLRPYTAGWLSHEEPLGFLFEGEGHLRYDRPIQRDIQFIEGGTQNVLGFAALSASIPLLLGLGPAHVYHYINGYLSELERGLISRGFTSLRSTEAELQSTILSVSPPLGTDLLALHQGLGSRGIVCSVPDGKLRFAPHFCNPESEVCLLLDAVDDYLRESRD